MQNAIAEVEKWTNKWGFMWEKHRLFVFQGIELPPLFKMIWKSSGTSKSCKVSRGLV